MKTTYSFGGPYGKDIATELHNLFPSESLLYPEQNRFIVLFMNEPETLEKELRAICQKHMLMKHDYSYIKD